MCNVVNIRLGFVLPSVTLRCQISTEPCTDGEWLSYSCDSKFSGHML